MKIKLDKGCKEVKLFIFDLDGTLIDSYRPLLDSFGYAFQNMGLEIPPEGELKKSIGYPLQDAFAMFVPLELVDQGTELFRKYYKDVVVQQTVLLPGAKETLQTLSQGALLAVATNKASHTAQKVLCALDIQKYFQAVVGVQCVDQPKPYPDMVEKLLEDLDVSAQEAVLVGDSVIDVELSQNSGVDLVCVLTGSNSFKELQAAGGKNILASSKSLLEICFHQRIPKIAN